MKDYVVLSVCKADLTDYLSQENYNHITDYDLERLASKLGNVILDGGGYWEGIEIWCNNYQDEHEL